MTPEEAEQKLKVSLERLKTARHMKGLRTDMPQPDRPLSLGMKALFDLIVRRRSPQG